MKFDFPPLATGDASLDSLRDPAQDKVDEFGFARVGQEQDSSHEWGFQRLLDKKLHDQSHESLTKV